MTSTRANFVLVTALLFLATPSYADNDVPIRCVATSDFSEPNSLSDNEIEAFRKSALKIFPDIERKALRAASLFAPERVTIRDKILLTNICEDESKDCIGFVFRKNGSKFVTAAQIRYGARVLVNTALSPDSGTERPLATLEVTFPNTTDEIHKITWSKKIGGRDLGDFSWERFLKGAKMELTKHTALKDALSRSIPKCF